MHNKPAVYIYTNHAPIECVQEVLAGLEEESIPATTITMPPSSPKLLAVEAANQSPLAVGIGINEAEAVMQIRNNATEQPVFVIPLNNKNCRTLGINAARAVKGGVFI